ncbi:ATP-binding cassette domain-containing protein [Paenibacillus spongiae]|uniref:ATP-binding cassette domain-containing protein n=1 Tax=Paenibacillus spongiae TaxID=2909671 RepID=A0ABY5S1V4_9BACL|nr:ATP-binding cassette domain-containing protein [Paenibacillus spongiae]UVI27614.1 ATP-binding cassette domain-containing protein [Paenibacillus spongiae]
MMNSHLMPLTIQGQQGADGKLQLQQGEITVLMGPNGAGKTRFMEIAAGLRDEGNLQISFGEEKLWTGDEARKRRRNSAALRSYSYACQSPEEQLFARSVETELEYVLKSYWLSGPAKEQRIDQALSAVGWDRSWLQRDPYQMSGGERRRAALACLFAAPAAWLLLDEPTAGLDAAGHELLGIQLNDCKAAGQGVLLISHDTDWALALADTVLLLRPDGIMRRCRRNEIVANPDLLVQSGMNVPEWLIVAHEMWRRGVSAEDVWDPAKLAAALTELGTDPIPIRNKETGTAIYPPLTQPEAQELNVGDRHLASVRMRPSPIAAFDPRSVWIAYILLSTGMFLQKSWSGIAWSVLLTAAAITIGRIPLRRWRGPIMALGLFVVIISIMAGLGKQANGSFWNWAAFLNAMQTFTRPWLAMLIGLGLPLAITPLRLRRSLEQLFTFRGRMPLWGQQVILTVTLLLRFVPVLLSEWERFSRIAVARGKVTRMTWRGAAGRLRDTSIPFMLALFRLAEQVANALESRGVGRRSYPALRMTERWRRRDSVLVAASLGLFAFLWWWAVNS